MCTVLLRFSPDAPWPVLLAAVRDEFADRPWDPPGPYWDSEWSGLIGGRDRLAGGTWLAVDPGSGPTAGRPGVAALLNGVRRPLLAEGPRPTRGTLALEVLSSGRIPSDADIQGYDGFHLLRAGLDAAEVWSWDGDQLTHRHLPPGDHILVNLGVDTDDDPLVPHFAPLLAALPDPPLEAGEPTEPASTAAAWGAWSDLLAGGGLDPADPRALIVRRQVEDRTYASTSASLVGLSAGRVRYDFNPLPPDPGCWFEVRDVR